MRSVWEPIFFECLEITNNVSKSCKAAGVSRTLVYRNFDESDEFAEKWRAAQKKYRKREIEIARARLRSVLSDT